MRRVDEGLKSSAYLHEALANPKEISLEGRNQTAFQVAFGTNLAFWDWYGAEANKDRRIRFGIGMDGWQKATDQNAILEGK